MIFNEGKIWIMWLNPCTWHNSSQVKLTNEESCERIMPTIVPVSLGNNRSSLTWKQLCQCHLGTIMPVSLRNYCASLTWEQLC